MATDGLPTLPKISQQRADATSMAGLVLKNESQEIEGDLAASGLHPGTGGYLSAGDLFQGLSSQDMAWLEQVTTKVICPRGKLIYGPDEGGQTLFLIKKGKVQVYRMGRDGKKLTLACLEEGSLFGEMVTLGQGMSNSYVEAVEDSVLDAMKRHHVEQLITAHPQVALRLLEAMGRRLVAAEMMIEEIAFKSVRARVASLLLRLGAQQGANTIGGFSHQALADMSGTIRETATQALNELRAHGLIDISRMSIRIVDPEGLRQAAET